MSTPMITPAIQAPTMIVTPVPSDMPSLVAASASTLPMPPNSLTIMTAAMIATIRMNGAAAPEMRSIATMPFQAE